MGKLWKLVKILSTDKFKLEKNERGHGNHENGHKHESHIDFQVHVFEDEERYEKNEPTEIIY